MELQRYINKKIKNTSFLQKKGCAFLLSSVNISSLVRAV
ncbi:MAG: hypothetical protein ACI8QY_000915, partial [bacterium]